MRNTMLSRGLVYLVTSLFSLALAIGGLTLFASPAHADGPPPTFDDRCGTTQDTVTLPSAPFNTWYINEVVYADDDTYPTPATDITVRTAGDYEGTWSFHYTNVACMPDAPDTFVVESKENRVCQPSYGLTLTDATFYDGAGSGLDSQNLNVKSVRSDGLKVTDHIADAVADGQSQPVKLGGTEGLLPGTWTSTVYESGVSTGASDVFFIDSCGYEVPPPGDGGSTFTPKGMLKQVKGTNFVRGKAINKKVAEKRKFILIGKKIVNGKVVKFRLPITVQAGKVVRIERFKAPIGSNVKLKAEQANGKYKVVKTLRVKRPLS